MRLQDNELDPLLHGIVHDLRGTIAEDDLFPPGHRPCSKILPKAREVVARFLFEAVIELAIVPRPHLGDDLDHVQERDRSRAPLGEACGDVQRLLVHIRQVDRHEHLLEHGPVLLTWVHPLVL